MEYHEYANIYRMLPEKELQSLADDIKAKGQLLPITSYEGKVLDGRNRYRACEIAGVDPKIEEYTGDDPLGLIASLNDHRRHDTDNERALVGARMANLKKGGVDGNKNASKTNGSMEPFVSRPAVSLERAAKLAGSTRANIRRAKPIVQTGIPELQDMAESGEVSIRAASEVAKLTPEEQRKAVAGGVQGVKDAAKRPTNATQELDPIFSDGTQPQKTNRIPKWIPDDAERLWLLAKTDLDKILPTDRSRERVLQEVITYAQTRIDQNK